MCDITNDGASVKDINDLAYGDNDVMNDVSIKEDTYWCYEWW